MAPREYSLCGDRDELTGDISQQPLLLSSLTGTLETTSEHSDGHCKHRLGGSRAGSTPGPWDADVPCGISMGDGSRVEP